MNPLISANNSLFLPLNQLNPYCGRLSNSLHDRNVSQKDRILLEQTLWNEVKKIRSLKDFSLFSYLIGYYHSILFQVSSVPASDDVFHYHVLIRLGDLNRYIERNDVAEYYYCNARNLFPNHGHAYNQLGLLIKPQANCYKCCYYYARASKSCDRPLKSIADSNLRIAVNNNNCELLSHILNDDACINPEDGKDLPSTAFEWFHVIVVAIYADNIQPIAKLLLSYLSENFSTQRATTTLHDNTKTSAIYCDQNSYLLLASLDILLDWLKLGSQGKTLLSAISPELRRIKVCLQSTIASYKSEKELNRNKQGVITAQAISQATDTKTFGEFANISNSTLPDSIQSDSPSRGIENREPGLPHDYVLRGFRPLESVHRVLHFKTRYYENFEHDKLHGLNGIGASQRFIESDRLIQILTRIRTKMDGFGQLLRKQTRNIALESILSNMNAST